MRPKVIATDLDGTVVRSDGTISPRTREAMAMAQAQGARLVVVTGRPPRWLTGIRDALGHDGTAICANGALTYDLADDRIVAARPIGLDVVRRLMAQLRASVPDVVFAVERIDGRFAHESAYQPKWEPEASTIVGDLEQVFDVPIAKLLGRVEGVDSDGLLAAARACVDDGLATLTHSSIDGLLEVMAYGVSKASTLAGWLAGQGLTAGDVIAFGDMPNDLELLTWAGRGVAVANAHPEVLAVADEVTLSNDEDGVAVVLERVYG